jgi:UDP-N-acetylglucosamine 2-epimerase (non-hydrolysing)
MRESARIEPVVIVTGQHREMIDPLLDYFGLDVDVDLDLMRPGQTLTDITCRVLTGLEKVLTERPLDLVAVQGDTTTSTAAALAAFYARVPVAHIEAGLRTNDRWSPYPEEMNRRLTTRLASLHLAPTRLAQAHLLAEGVEPESIVVTGNTVIDALLWSVERRTDYGDPALAPFERDEQRPMVLVTLHRRESWGAPMREAATAIATLATQRPEVSFVVPMHRNPVVREALVPVLGSLPNVVLTEPLTYGPFSRLISRSTLVLTDSGGVQEEAPSLGKPVLVCRENTERPEAVTAGTVRLVGTDATTIVAEVDRLLDDPKAYAEMAHAVNPYGDGLAAGRSLQAIEKFLGLTDDAVDEFDPDGTLSTLP